MSTNLSSSIAGMANIWTAGIHTQKKKHLQSVFFFTFQTFLIAHILSFVFRVCDRWQCLDFQKFDIQFPFIRRNYRLHEESITTYGMLALTHGHKHVDVPLFCEFECVTQFVGMNKLDHIFSEEWRARVCVCVRVCGIKHLAVCVKWPSYYPT